MWAFDAYCVFSKTLGKLQHIVWYNPNLGLGLTFKNVKEMFFFLNEGKMKA